jgi:hypothetical protein
MSGLNAALGETEPEGPICSAGAEPLLQEGFVRAGSTLASVPNVRVQWRT